MEIEIMDLMKIHWIPWKITTGSKTDDSETNKSNFNRKRHENKTKRKESGNENKNARDTKTKRNERENETKRTENGNASKTNAIESQTKRKRNEMIPARNIAAIIDHGYQNGIEPLSTRSFMLLD